MAAPTSQLPSENIFVANPKTFPIKTKQTAVIVNNIKTELVCTTYSDRLFLIVTQYNKVGTLVNVTADKVDDGSGEQTQMYSTDVLMGRDEPMTHVLARTLVSKLNTQQPILISIALKDTASKSVKTLAELLPSLVAS